MKRVVCMGAMLCLFMPGLVSGRQQSKAQTPRLSSDDVRPPVGSAPDSDDADTTSVLSDTKGSPVRNPLAILRNSLSRMSTITSLRTHLEVSAEQGTRELNAEMVKPDRIRITSPDTEIVAIGQTYYVRRPGED